MTWETPIAQIRTSVGRNFRLLLISAVYILSPNHAAFYPSLRTAASPECGVGVVTFGLPAMPFRFLWYRAHEDAFQATIETLEAMLDIQAAMRRRDTQN
ncbi:hypothetical protein PG987_000095 [Apiospora arundinis]